MKKGLRISVAAIMLLVFGCRSGEQENIGAKIVETGSATPEPLQSWNDGKVKRAIISYVQKVTDTASPDFIPVHDRLATFDNDGTLWAERPYVQELFAFYMVKKMIAKDHELAKNNHSKQSLKMIKATSQQAVKKHCSS